MLNTIVRTFQPTSLSLTWSHSFTFRIRKWIGLFMALILFSAFGLVYAKDQCRQLTEQLQTLENNYQTLQNQWTQLLLEESAWSSRERIETIAKQRLAMEIPSAKTILIESIE